MIQNKTKIPLISFRFVSFRFLSTFSATKRKQSPPNLPNYTALISKRSLITPNQPNKIEKKLHKQRKYDGKWERKSERIRASKTKIYNQKMKKTDSISMKVRDQRTDIAGFSPRNRFFRFCSKKRAYLLWSLPLSLSVVLVCNWRERIPSACNGFMQWFQWHAKSVWWGDWDPLSRVLC